MIGLLICSCMIAAGCSQSNKSASDDAKAAAQHAKQATSDATEATKKATTDVSDRHQGRRCEGWRGDKHGRRGAMDATKNAPADTADATKKGMHAARREEQRNQQ